VELDTTECTVMLEICYRAMMAMLGGAGRRWNGLPYEWGRHTTVPQAQWVVDNRGLNLYIKSMAKSVKHRYSYLTVLTM
jgi:hypothetical protein